MFTTNLRIKPFALQLIAAAFVLLPLLAVPNTGAAEAVPIPELAQWESRMVTFGKQHCGLLSNGSATLDMTLFDAERVYYQMAKYTGDPSWKYCANSAESVYRDRFVLPKDGAIQEGYLVFTLGLKMDHFQTGDALSRDAVVKLAQNSYWASSATLAIDTEPYWMSLEVAQALMAYVDAIDLTGTKPAKYDTFVTQALGHIDQWFVQKLWMEDGSMPLSPSAVGMTLQGLIQAHSSQADPRIPAKIKMALDGLWNLAWRSSQAAFFSDSQNPLWGDPNYNLLIASAYAWYYKYTIDTGHEDTLYRDRGDQVFAGGVKGASLDLVWDFNRNYMWSFDYVIWRQPPSAPPVPAPTPAPGPAPAPPNGAPVCTKAEANPSMLWPPNDRMIAVEIAGVTDPENDPISLRYSSINQDEPVKGLDKDDVGTDAAFQSGTLYVRAQRAGNGDGRVYEVQFEAKDPNGGSCTGIVTVTVPHDKSELAHHGGRRFNSMER
jgi:hypothetical protein